MGQITYEGKYSQRYNVTFTVYDFLQESQDLVQFMMQQFINLAGSDPFQCSEYLFGKELKNGVAERYVKLYAYIFAVKMFKW